MLLQKNLTNVATKTNIGASFDAFVIATSNDHRLLCPCRKYTFSAEFPSSLLMNSYPLTVGQCAVIVYTTSDFALGEMF